MPLARFLPLVPHSLAACCYRCKLNSVPLHLAQHRPAPPHPHTSPSPQVPQGGWFTLAVALVVTVVIFIWWSGASARRKVLLETSKQQSAHNIFFEHNK